MERSYQIVTDSACDMPDEYYAAHDVECIRLGFTMDGVTYGGEDGEQIAVKDFYEKLRGGAMPKTFQITPAQAKLHFEKFAKEGKDVFVLAFSSGLSGTCESYVSAAHEIEETYRTKVVVVDSLCASMGEGLLLDYIVKKADEGASIGELQTYAEGLKQHVCHYFTVDDLRHLKRGGRVSATTAAIGSILKIKPVLHVDENGHLIAIGKAIGRKKSISELVDHMCELNTLQPGDPIFISHGDCIGDVTYLTSLLRERFGGREIFVNEIGSVIGAHSGAGTVALFFLGKHR